MSKIIFGQTDVLGELSEMKKQGEEIQNFRKEQKENYENLRSFVRGVNEAMKIFKSDLEEDVLRLKVSHMKELKVRDERMDRQQEKMKTMEKEIQLLKAEVDRMKLGGNMGHPGNRRVEVDQIEEGNVEERFLKKKEEEKFHNLTNILTLQQCSKILQEFGQPKPWKRIFRASEHNFSAREFHKSCDQYKGTLIVIQTTTGNILGGYNPFKWNEVNLDYFDSTGSWLFGFLENGREFKKIEYNNNGYGICCNSSYGPTFGGGHDLYVVDRCNLDIRTKKKCYTNTTNSYVHKGLGKHCLNGGVFEFIVKDYEVFTFDE